LSFLSDRGHIVPVSGSSRIVTVVRAVFKVGLFGLALGVSVPAARAQAPASPFAIIRGYVFDSLLTNATLPGASVMLTGTATRTVQADARGRFAMDSLAPGKYTITFRHPSLAEVGYTPQDWSLDLKAGTVSRLFLATTSGAAVYARVCPNTRETQVGAVLGSLKEVATREPVAGGEVRVEWSESSISKELGMSRRLRSVRAETDSLGHYQLCGVPNDAAVLLRAQARGLNGAPLELALEGRSLAIRLLTIDLSDSTGRVANDGVLDHGTAVLKGTIRQTTGEPLPEAQVLVLGLPNGAQSTPTGGFEIKDLPGGSHTVEIRAIGFARKRELVDLDPTKPVELDIKMTKMAAVLPELSVTAKAAAGQSEFDKRRTSAAGAGHFITREDIDRRNPLRTEDLFRTVAGLSVVPSGGFDYSVVSSRGAGFNGRCSPDFYVDGAKVTVDPQIGGGIPVNPHEIYGIEVYSGPASVPAQFQTQNGCGAIVIWTQRGQARRARQ
jgi:hypothetical protein